MNDKKSRRIALQLTLVGVLCLAYVGFALAAAQKVGCLVSHMAYLPIVLAALWWGRNGIWVAIVLAITSFLLFQAHSAGCGLATISYVVVGAAVGVVQERWMTSRAGQSVAESRFQQFVEKSMMGIFVYRDDLIIYCNPRFEEIVGYSSEEGVGVSFWQFIHEDDRPKVRRLVDQRKTGKQDDLHYECRLIAKDGKLIWCEITSSTINFEGQRAILVNVYNITRHKKAEERQQELSTLALRQEEQLVHSTRLAEMGEMAAGVAHELNQPLTGIKNFARNAMYMLEVGAGNLEEVKDNLQMISGQVDRASRIINQMRELAHRSERHYGPVDVNRLLRESVEFVTPQMRLTGVQVKMQLANDLPALMADSVRLEQVFLNLLMNARHAMEDTAERSLTVRSRLDKDSERPVVVEIIDTGKGFAPGIADKLFTPFFTTKPAGHGTGLGLSISLSIIKDHNGTIEAVGAEGKGATFTVRLPVTNSSGRDDQSFGRQDG